MSSTVRISWQGKPTREQANILNDAFNVMGMQAAVDAGEGKITQADVDAEVARLDAKYKKYDSAN